MISGYTDITLAAPSCDIGVWQEFRCTSESHWQRARGPPAAVTVGTVLAGVRRRPTMPMTRTVDSSLVTSRFRSTFSNSEASSSPSLSPDMPVMTLMILAVSPGRRDRATVTKCPTGNTGRDPTQPEAGIVPSLIWNLGSCDITVFGMIS